MKVWLRDPIPVRITIKGITYEINADKVSGGPQQMNLIATRLDNRRSIPLNVLPPSWFREEFDRHAWFESKPRTPARRLADALIFQDLAELEPKSGWLYRYEGGFKWNGIALGCEYHDGNGWKKKESDALPRLAPATFWIRY